MVSKQFVTRVILFYTQYEFHTFTILLYYKVIKTFIKNLVYGFSYIFKTCPLQITTIIRIN